ncbi:MAG: 1-phosphofructokinase family hexose kinase, partial [Acutalibacteraceae bacterium]
LDDGMTRINLKLIADGETEINPPGPAVDDAAMARLLGELDAVVPGDTVVIAGSAPCGQPNARETILQRAAERGADTVVDAAGEALIRALSYRPFLIKPNRTELSEAAGRDLPDDDDVIAAAGELQKKGARHVLVSLGGDGGLLIEENGRVHRVRAPAGQARYTVGAGDSMLAGFLAGWQKTGDPAYALRMGIAAGSATAFSDDLADRAAIERIFQTLF